MEREREGGREGGRERERERALLRVLLLFNSKWATEERLKGYRGGIYTPTLWKLVIGQRVPGVSGFYPEYSGKLFGHTIGHTFGPPTVDPYTSGISLDTLDSQKFQA